MDIPCCLPNSLQNRDWDFCFFVSTIAIAGQKEKKNLALKTTVVGNLILALFLDVFSGCPTITLPQPKNRLNGKESKEKLKSRERMKQEAPFPGCSPEKMSIFSRGWALGLHQEANGIKSQNIHLPQVPPDPRRKGNRFKRGENRNTFSALPSLGTAPLTPQHSVGNASQGWRHHFIPALKQNCSGSFTSPQTNAGTPSRGCHPIN